MKVAAIRLFVMKIVLWFSARVGRHHDCSTLPSLHQDCAYVSVVECWCITQLKLFTKDDMKDHEWLHVRRNHLGRMMLPQLLFAFELPAVQLDCVALFRCFALVDVCCLLVLLHPRREENAKIVSTRLNAYSGNLVT